MDKQKKDVMDFVTEQSAKGKAITETLREIGIKRSTYYSWLNPDGKKKDDLPNTAMLTPEEKKAIEDAKEEHLLPRTLSSLIPLPFSHNPLYKNITVSD